MTGIIRIPTRFVALDTETTGFSDSKDRIVEIGAVEVIDGHIGRRMHAFISDDVAHIPYDAWNVHGIPGELIPLVGIPWRDLAPVLYHFIGDSPMVIHNAAFDLRMMKASNARGKIETPDIPVIDTLKLARDLWPGQKGNLDVVAERLGIRNDDRHHHGALLDTLLLCRVYLAMGTLSLDLDAEAAPPPLSADEEVGDWTPPPPPEDGDWSPPPLLVQPSSTISRRVLSPSPADIEAHSLHLQSIGMTP